MPTFKEMIDTAKKEDRKEKRALLESFAKRSCVYRLVHPLAVACHTTDETIKNYYRGYREPSELVMETIAKQLKMDKNELFPPKNE